MSYGERVKGVFLKQGFSSNSKLRKSQFEQFLNSLSPGEPYDMEVAAEIWEQAANGNQQVTVQELSRTISDAQNIVKTRLLDINEQIKVLEKGRDSIGNSPYKSRNNHPDAQLDQLNEEKMDFEEDLRYLTEPFGINMIVFMAGGGYSRTEGPEASSSGGYLDPNGNEVELKWLFMLSLLFGLMEVIVIYKKYDFLNLMVLTCLAFIFLMNHFDPLYIKSTLSLLIISEILDAIWLFMNSGDYWSPPKQGVNSSYEEGYLKLIIVLTYLGIFMKIPLGVFLFHYRNAQENKQYNIDIGIAKISLTPNKLNPFSHTLKNIEILN